MMKVLVDKIYEESTIEGTDKGLHFNYNGKEFDVIFDNNDNWIWKKGRRNRQIFLTKPNRKNKIWIRKIEGAYAPFLLDYYFFFISGNLISEFPQIL